MNKRSKFLLNITTLGPIGYVGASGTVATLFTIPLVYALHYLVPTARYYFACVLVLFFASVFIVNKVLKSMRRHDDPSEIVLDEVVGCLLTFWGIALSTQSIIVGFILFRALDIIKFGLVRRAEQWADGWGVMGDDIVAALIANIILRLLF